MAGHSQFKNIMHRKGRQDKKRAQAFQKITREIMVAVKEGGDNPSGNSRLKLAIQNARSQSMPKDNIERAIKRASGNASGENYEALRYEGFGPGGVAIMVEVLTDNRNRSASDLRTIFTKNDGNLGEANSVAYMFQKIGHIRYGKDKNNEDVFHQAIEAGAEDVMSDEEGHDIYVMPEQLHQLADGLEKTLGTAVEVKLSWRPTIMAKIENREQAQSLFNLIEQLDDHDDVQEVIVNVEMDDALLANLS